MSMTPIHEILRDVVARTAEAYGARVSYLYGDWPYIADTLTRWNADASAALQKYPIVCLYSPYEERRQLVGGRMQSEATLELLLLVNTEKNYLNEDRDALSFAQVLRPIYWCFMGQIMKDARIVKNYTGIPAHTYTENYRYGRLGVRAADDRPFADFIDAIEIKNLVLTFKETC